MHPLCLPVSPVVQNAGEETDRSVQSHNVIVTGYVTGNPKTTGRLHKIEPQIRKPASPSGSSIGASGIDPVSSSDDSASLPPYQPQVLQPHVLEPQEQKSQSVSGAFNIYHRIAQAEELKKKYFPGFGQTGTPVTVGGHGYNHFPIGNHKIERNFDEDDEEIDVDA